MAEPAPTLDRDRSDRLSAIGLMCVAVLCFSCLDACAKWANRFVDPLVTTWFRYTVNVALVALVLNRWTRPRLLHSNRFALQVLRSVLLLACTLLSFFALPYIQLTQSIAIQFTMPLLVVLLAGPMLGEQIGLQRLAAVAFGFVGVLIVARPGTGALPPQALLIGASTICYAFYAIVTRMLAAYDPPATTITYSGLAGVLVLTPVVPVVWTSPPSLLVLAVMLGTGFFGAVGHGLLTLAHSRAPAGVLSPFIYTQVIWSTALGMVVFGDYPDAWTIVGAVVVVASGLYLLAWERANRSGRR